MINIVHPFTAGKMRDWCFWKKCRGKRGRTREEHVGFKSIQRPVWLTSLAVNERSIYIQLAKAIFSNFFFLFFSLSLSHSLSSVFFSLFTLGSTTTPHLLLAAKAYLLSYILHFSLPSSFFFPLKISYKVKSFHLYLYYPLSLWIHYHYHYQIRSKYLCWSATAL